MNAFQVITSNYLINVGFIAWFTAQILKTVLAYIPNKKVNWERLVGAGGMPSSHSSLVCAIAVGVAKKVGYGSPEFALSLALAGIVMYDAMGVRRAAGEQAKVLNQMVVDFKDMFLMLKEEFDALARGNPAEETDDTDDTDAQKKSKRLKEFLGHTPLEVLCGAILGIVIAVVIPSH
ncbi:divergent PAP2 family protein [Oscillospiraceae bacterium PP1C4]